MGIGNNFFGDAATLFKKFYENPEKLTVCHSDSSPTYIAKVRGREPFIFQLRLADRLLIDMDNIQEFLGDLTPKTRVLAEDVYIGRRTFSIYEQSIIPGEPFSTLWSNREYSKLPRASEGIAKFFAKCLIPGILASSTPLLHDRNWYQEAMTVLDQACSTKDPLLTPYVGDFEDIRRAVQGGILDELPMSISNGNISAQNILVTKEGEVSGIIDWQRNHYRTRPLGSDLHAIHWIRTCYRGDRCEDEKITPAIEARFWKAFLSATPRDIANNRKALQYAMKLGIVLENVHDGKSRSPKGSPSLRMQLDYEIPSMNLNIA